jgi:outer membrane protein assembly factor BamA
MLIKFRISMLIAILLLGFDITAQNDSLKTDSSFYQNIIDHENSHNKALNPYFKAIDSLKKVGYLSAYVVVKREDTIDKFQIEKGKRFKWALLEYENKEQLNDKKLKNAVSSETGKYISVERIEYIKEKILNHFENSGYPFAKVYLDSIKFIGEDSIAAKIIINQNKKIIFDSIKVVSDIDLSNKYLSNVLNLKKGENFNKDKVSSISKTISNINFIKLKSQPVLVFMDNKFNINLDLIPQKVNRFDFLLGLQQIQESGIQKYKITGDVLAELINKLGKGERIFFNYKNLNKGKQELVLQTDYPYAFNLPFGLNAAMQIFVNTSEYTDIGFDLGISFLITNENRVKIFWNKKSSRLITVDGASILNMKKLPEKLDFANDNLGIGSEFINYDYRINPSQGFGFKADVIVGKRKIKKNHQILELKNEYIDFKDSYDSLGILSTTYEINSEFRFYKPLFGNFVLNFNNYFAYKYIEKNIFQNEQFRIGGQSLFRGFDEKSIFCDLYDILGIEIKLMIDRNSNLFVFSEYGFVRNRLNLDQKWDNPFSVGTGIKFDTKNGLLQLVAAVGSQYGDPINFRNANIHIGYTSLFN